MGFGADEPRALPWADMNDTLGVSDTPRKPWLDPGHRRTLSCTQIIKPIMLILHAA
jgi:hypothetical protein